MNDARTLANAAEAELDAFCTGLSPKDRTNIEKHLAVCDAESTPDHGRLWRRLVLGLGRLGPYRTQTTGFRAIQFYVQDGKYKMQLFALEDPRNGTLALYTADVLAAAIQGGILRGPVEAGPVSEAGDGRMYEVCAMPGVTIMVELLNAQNTSTAPDYYRHMLGWNRRAMRITLPVKATPSQVQAAEMLYALAARHANPC